MRVQIQLDGPEVAQTGEACDGHQGINRSKNQAKPPHPIRVIPEPGPKSDGAAEGGNVRLNISWRKNPTTPTTTKIAPLNTT